MTEPLIRLQGVSRIYGTEGAAVAALQDVDLEIHRGEFVAIVGPSGGGKTTLLSILGLLEVPSVGSYELNAIETTELTERERTRLRAGEIGFVFQAFHLLDRRPLVDSVEMGLLYRGVDRAQRERAAVKALTTVGLGDRGGALAKDLSGGQRQRAAIARALASDTRILLADEPTGNLDSRNGQAILDELQRVHAHGATVIVVTHSETVAAAAARRIHMSDGRILSDTGKSSHTGPTPRVDRDPGLIPQKTGRRWGDLVRDAVESVLSRRSQTTALVVAVALATALVVISLGLGATARAQVADTFDRHANREVTAHVISTPDNPIHQGTIVTHVRSVAGVVSVATLVAHGPIRVSALGGTAQITIRIVTGDFATATSSKITWGGSTGPTLRSGSVIIGRSLAQQLKLGPIDNTPTITINGASFAVVGILESSDRLPELSGQVVTSDEALVGPSDWEKDITVAVTTSTGAARQVGRQLPLVINPTDPTQVDVKVPIDPTTIRQNIEGGVQIALGAFTALAILIAIATLANAIGISVLARRGEFGLRRAVGAQSGQLAGLVTCESAIIGFIGGVVGLFVGFAVILIFTITQRWIPVFDLKLAPIAVGLGVLLAAMSSTVGAIRAARIRPAIALRE